MEMTWQKCKAAVEIMSSCDCLSITEDDKSFIIAAFGSILKFLRKWGFANQNMTVQYAILKESTWDNGYFCIVTKQMCNIVYPIVRDMAGILDILEENANGNTKIQN
jgi:hypothetical protein